MTSLKILTSRRQTRWLFTSTTEEPGFARKKYQATLVRAGFEPELTRDLGFHLRDNIESLESIPSLSGPSRQEKIEEFDRKLDLGLILSPSKKQK